MIDWITETIQSGWLAYRFLRRKPLKISELQGIVEVFESPEFSAETKSGMESIMPVFVQRVYDLARRRRMVVYKLKHS